MEFLLDERPKEVNAILSQLKYWDKKNMIIFLEEFIQNNCDKVSLWLTDEQIIDNLENQSEKDLKIQIINLLQNIKKEDKVIVPSYILS
jgi:hypothetical protein